MPSERWRVVVADASPLIALLDAEHLWLLRKLYREVSITDVVRDEVRGDLPSWISVTSDYERATYLQFMVRDALDRGEASALALARNTKHAVILIDERKGRSVARREEITAVGTLGLIVAAKRLGHITAGSPVIDRLRRGGLWVSDQLYGQIRELLGE